MKARVMWTVAFVLSAAGATHAQTPLGTVFTYQGQLKSGGSPASGSFNMVFKLFDAVTIGNQVGPTLTFDGAGGNPPPVAIANGLFTVQLDFGSVFSGNKRWLEVAVNGTTLAPRQELTAAPNSLFALNSTAATNATQLNGQAAAFYQNASNLSSGTIPDARLAGVYSGALALTNAGNTFTGSGSGLTALNASNISLGLLAPAFGGTGLNTSAASTGSILYTSSAGSWSVLPPGANAQVLTVSGGVPVWAAGSAGLTLPYSGTANTTSTEAFSVTDTGTGIAIHGVNNAAGGVAVVGTATGVSGSRGVLGLAIASSGVNYGVYGQGDSPDAIGVYGSAASGSGPTSGVFGRSESTSGVGVEGYAPSSTGQTYAVRGVNLSDTGTGVFGRAFSATGITYGVYGQSDSSSGYGGYFLGRGYFSGNVGMGTTTPTASLTIAGANNIGSSSAAVELANTTASTGRTYLLGSTSGGLFQVADMTAGSATRLVLDASGNVGIGTVTPSSKLHVVGNIQASGSVFASCGTLSCSDERFKANVVPLTEAMSIVEKLRPVRFDWKRDQFPKQQFSKDGQIGLIAQEVQKVVPEVVSKGSDGYYSIDYGRLTPLLVEAIKQIKSEKDTQAAQQQQVVEQLHRIVRRQEAENARLRADLDELRQAVSEIRGKSAKEMVTR